MALTISLEDFADRLDRLGPDLRRAAEHAMERAAPALADLVVETIGQPTLAGLPAPVDTGQLQQSVRVDGTTVKIDAPHAGFVEYGTRPHMPPVAPLAAWALRKGLAVDEAEARGVGWAVARKIAEHGTAPRHYMRRAINKFRRRRILWREMRLAFAAIRRGR